MNNNWSEGTIRIPTDEGGYVDFHYEVKHFKGRSKFGIEGGRISKLFIRETKSSEVVCNYDRGWDIVPEGKESYKAYYVLKTEYN
jgi:hypothetical protein